MPSASSTPTRSRPSTTRARSSSFDAENGRLDAAIAQHPAGRHARARAGSEDKDARYGWFWQLKNLPDAPESRYLYAVLAGHDFQEGLKNYRDLVYLSGTLARWDDSMVAFEDMIETRERAYAERLPRADALLASGAVDKLQQRDAALEARSCARIETPGTTWRALGHRRREREQWARVQRLEAAALRAAPPETPENAELRARLALVKGVLFYRLNDAYGARLWQEQRGAQGPRSGAARGAEPLDPRRARAQERAGQHR